MRTHVQKTVSMYFAVLRAAATFNSPFSTSDYVPDSYCLFGTVNVRLRKCRLDRSSCLPVPSSSVGDERGSTAHLRPASLRPHLRRAHQPPLAPGSGVKTAVLVYKSTHGTAPSYPSQLVRVADLPGRRSLRSARTNRLLVPSVKLSTIGGRAFPIAGPTI